MRKQRRGESKGQRGQRRAAEGLADRDLIETVKEKMRGKRSGRGQLE